MNSFCGSIISQSCRFLLSTYLNILCATAWYSLKIPITIFSGCSCRPISRSCKLRCGSYSPWSQSSINRKTANIHEKLPPSHDPLQYHRSWSNHLCCSLWYLLDRCIQSLHMVSRKNPKTEHVKSVNGRHHCVHIYSVRCGCIVHDRRISKSNS